MSIPYYLLLYILLHILDILIFFIFSGKSFIWWYLKTDFEKLLFYFRPSSSKEEDIDLEYYEAEARGLKGDCSKYFHDCPISLFDFVTTLVEYQGGK